MSSNPTFQKFLRNRVNKDNSKSNGSLDDMGGKIPAEVPRKTPPGEGLASLKAQYVIARTLLAAHMFLLNARVYLIGKPLILHVTALPAVLCLPLECFFTRKRCKWKDWKWISLALGVALLAFLPPMWILQLDLIFKDEIKEQQEEANTFTAIHIAQDIQEMSGVDPELCSLDTLLYDEDEAEVVAQPQQSIVAMEMVTEQNPINAFTYLQDGDYSQNDTSQCWYVFNNFPARVTFVLPRWYAISSVTIVAPTKCCTDNVLNLNVLSAVDTNDHRMEYGELCGFIKTPSSDGINVINCTTPLITKHLQIYQDQMLIQGQPQTVLLICELIIEGRTASSAEINTAKLKIDRKKDAMLNNLRQKRDFLPQKFAGERMKRSPKEDVYAPKAKFILLDDSEELKDTITLVLSQVTMVMLLLIRWLLPRPVGMTSEQLAALMGNWLGMMADQLNFINMLKEELIRDDKYAVIIILLAYSVSQLQFALVFTSRSTHQKPPKKRDPKEHKTSNKDKDMLARNQKNIATNPSTLQHNGIEEVDPLVSADNAQETITKPPLAKCDSLRGSAIIPINHDCHDNQDPHGNPQMSREDADVVKQEPSDSETRATLWNRLKIWINNKIFGSFIWATFSTLSLQDLPFLSIRVYAVSVLGVMNHSVAYFIGKNLVVTCIHTYRVVIFVLAERARKRRNKARTAWLKMESLFASKTKTFQLKSSGF